MGGVSYVASVVVSPFPKAAYTQADIAELPDSDGDNKIVNGYDELTRHGTIQPERGPFQNYMVSIFPYFYYLRVFTMKFIIVATVVHVMQLGWFTNEATDTLSHPSNSTASYSALRGFAEVSMVSIFILHPNVLLNSLYCRLFLCRGSARVLNNWCFTVTASEPSMWVITFHHRLPLQVICQVQTAVEKPLYKLHGLPTCPRMRATMAPPPSCLVQPYYRGNISPPHLSLCRSTPCSHTMAEYAAKQSMPNLTFSKLINYFR
jgi:hypothetical protein